MSTTTVITLPSMTKGFTPHAGRTVDVTKPVKVYFNLHKKRFSIQQDGLVVGHADEVNLKQVSFKVSEAGRQRVIREQKKNVHAYVIGLLAVPRDESSRKAIYNPYKYDSFMIEANDTLRRLGQAERVQLVGKQMLVKGAVISW